MITLKNLETEYPNINQSILPAPLKQNEFDYIIEKKYLYANEKATTTTKLIDTFIEKLNAIAAKQPKAEPSKLRIVKTKKQLSKGSKKVTRAASKKRVKASSKKNEPEAQPKTVGKKEIKKGHKLSLRKTARKTPVKAIISKPQTIKKPKMKTEKQSKKTTFTAIPQWLAVIRKFTAMANKEFTHATLRTFLKTIQIAFTATKNGNTPHVDLIRNIQMTIVTSVNEQIKLSKIKLKANAGLVAKCKEVSKAYSIKKRLPSSGTVEVKALSGLQGIIPSTELAGMEFQTLPFTGKFLQLIGNPTKPFQIMIYGLPGSGKSTLAIQFAKYLAEAHNLKVLYLAKEEGISGTSKEKFMRLNAIHEYISITEKMPTDISNFDVLMIDSVNEMNMTPNDIRAIQTKYPKLSTVQLFKATKEGKFLGASDFAHLCQAEIRCFEGKAQAQKNRFGGNVEIKILE